MADPKRRWRVVIMGAAGRDFHNFNTVYRDDPESEVVAFTATQIPYISDRTYPRSLAGPLYPKGIPIVPEEELHDLVWGERIDEVVFAYSDVSHEHVMHRASIAIAAGADFRLLGPAKTMLPSSKPVVAVCAARTGAGKSQTTRRVARILQAAGQNVVVVRHPMPYGDLEAQRAQRFATYEDLDRAKVTIEEREEFEPHIDRGTVVYCGVDYEEILESAEKEADVVLWDGGNNDLPFYRPDVHITVVDPLRAGHETRYHPGEANVRMAHAIVINKVDSATEDQVRRVESSVRDLNPSATIVKARSPITIQEDFDLAGKRVLVVEDGPTLTHGEMEYGAGVVAARRAGAAEIVDPRAYAVGTIAETYERYPGVGALLPAMGYSDEQVADLAATINATPADVVVIATPVDLRRLADIQKPAVRVTYELEEEGSPTLADVLAPIVS
ncbi:MAG TPA: cyclic 2,3-diphosphoglycerate synthase [Actinomycetota bacterium]|nr:cyclic 2,3-diphosphoglycerate synthase [Actinomycetota bacterium]